MDARSHREESPDGLRFEHWSLRILLGWNAHLLESVSGEERVSSFVLLTGPGDVNRRSSQGRACNSRRRAPGEPSPPSPRLSSVLPRSACEAKPSRRAKDEALTRSKKGSRKGCRLLDERTQPHPQLIMREWHVTPCPCS